MAWRHRLRRWYRAVTGKCALCAGPRYLHAAFPQQHPPQCYHCQAGNPSWCHACNKRVNWPKAYGMGAPITARQFMRDVGIPFTEGNRPQSDGPS